MGGWVCGVHAVSKGGTFYTIRMFLNFHLGTHALFAEWVGMQIRVGHKRALIVGLVRRE